MTVSADVLAALTALARARRSNEPGAGPFLVVVDGPAGSGKTTLAAQLAPRLGDGNGGHAQVVHMDDLYEGWAAGPDGGAARLAAWVLTPLAEHRPGRYRRFDWAKDEYAEWHTVAPAAFLVIEGCGSGARALDPHPHLLLWVEADDDERLRRGLARDGERERDHWTTWMADEAAHYEREGTRDRADVRLDGFGEVVTWHASPVA
ncbi:uridine kinase family protein [Xylanimonas protaetiae]|uniref:Uridine kinase n=1 Tax=Xylanimonas protaetiae TaxID=2509457 RepID=A0A4P6F446_9MICO|nr:AAA family ATPase [Xylanimonas protaetiae]QAY70680.1 uridine kinase [Xylanimonas protaetiae]